MPGGSKKGGGLTTKKSAFYKMKGFSGFGNSPLTDKGHDPKEREHKHKKRLFGGDKTTYIEKLSVPEGDKTGSVSSRKTIVKTRKGGTKKSETTITAQYPDQGTKVTKHWLTGKKKYGVKRKPTSSVSKVKYDKSGKPIKETISYTGYKKDTGGALSEPYTTSTTRIKRKHKKRKVRKSDRTL